MPTKRPHKTGQMYAGIIKLSSSKDMNKLEHLPAVAVGNTAAPPARVDLLA
jgi:hypothetical protein